MITNVKARICFVIFLAVTGLKAQDPHFSQYREVPMLLNPALTAAFDTYRASANYRTQWRGVTTPFTTLAASFEMKLDQTPWTKEKSKRVRIYHQSLNKLNAGVQFLTDKAGDGSYKTTLALLSLSKSVQLNDANALALGLQGGALQRSINNGAFLWPDQFNGNVYSNSLPSGESFSGERYTQADFSAGLVWNHGYETSLKKINRAPKWTLGAALQHLNRARHSFFTAGNGREMMKLTLHTRAEITLPGNRTALLPEIMFVRQGIQQELLAGVMFRRRFGEDSKFTSFRNSSDLLLGIQYRNRDAFVISCIAEFNQLAFGISYDATISTLRESGRTGGGIEVVLRYSAAHIYLYQNK